MAALPLFVWVIQLNLLFEGHTWIFTSIYGSDAARLFLASMIVLDPRKKNTATCKVPYIWSETDMRCCAFFLCRRQFQCLFGVHDNRMLGLSKIAEGKLTHKYSINTVGSKKEDRRDANRTFVWLDGAYKLPPDRSYDGNLLASGTNEPWDLYQGLYEPAEGTSWRQLMTDRYHIGVPMKPGEKPTVLTCICLGDLHAKPHGQYPYHEDGDGAKTH